jgi:hypothetical protein
MGKGDLKSPEVKFLCFFMAHRFELLAKFVSTVMNDFHQVTHKPNSIPFILYGVKERSNCLKECCVIDTNSKRSIQGVVIVKTILTCPCVGARCDARVEDGDLGANLVKAPLCPPSKVTAERAICCGGYAEKFIAPFIESWGVFDPLGTMAAIMTVG